MDTTVARPPLRYYGGKWRIAPWIIRHFPPHVCYAEPFGGGMAVLLRKPPSHHEVYNDIDAEVVNFFRVLRERPDDLIHAIELTPYSRNEFTCAYEPAEDPLERARRFYIRSWQGRGTPATRWKTGWRFQKAFAGGKRVVDDWNRIEHLWHIARRLKSVQIEHDDAFKIIERYDTPTTLFYLDPPYPPGTRSKWRNAAYRYEMSDKDHRRLAEVLHRIRGMAVISSYPSTLYNELYADWRRITTRTTTDAGRTVTEVIWLSPSVIRASMPLFLFGEQEEQGG